MYREFTIGGATYRTSGIDPLAQTHIARLLLPMISALVPMLKKHSTGVSVVQPRARDLGLMIEESQPLLAALAGVSGETHDYVIAKAMAKVERSGVGGRWERVWDAKRGGLIVEGISGADLLVITATVVADDMAPFIATLADRIPAAAIPKLRLDA
jgi:hypothetical protein